MAEKVISITRYTAKYKEQWNQFVADAKNGLFMFDRNYMEYHSDRFEDHSLMFWKGDELIALLPTSEKDRILTSHGGLTYGGLITSEKIKQHTVCECMEVLKNYAEEQGMKQVIYKTVPHIYHIQPAEEDIYALYQQGADIKSITASTVVDLDKPIKMPKGRKAQISRARREGVEIRKLCSEKDYNEFIHLENEVLNARHGLSAVHTGDELFLLHTRFPKNIHLYGAYLDDNLIAGTILFEYRTVVHTQYLAANGMARELGALDMVIGTVIEKYRDKKKWLDFGISTDHDGKVLNNGLISQKEGFGGRTNIYMTWKILGG